MITRLKSYALTALAVLLVMVGAYAAGGRAARQAAERKREYEEALRAAAGAKGIQDARLQVGKMSSDAVRDELRRNWVRGK